VRQKPFAQERYEYPLAYGNTYPQIGKEVTNVICFESKFLDEQYLKECREKRNTTPKEKLGTKNNPKTLVKRGAANVVQRLVPD
jgi:hypothetical protein